jgi:hypothetical protein
MVTVDDTNIFRVEIAMKRITIALGVVLATLLIMLAGCDEPAIDCHSPEPTPEPVRIADADLVENWDIGTRRKPNGSCVVACAATDANMRGDKPLAKWLQRKMGGGYSFVRFKRECQTAGVPVALMRTRSIKWVTAHIDAGNRVIVGYTPRDQYPDGYHAQLAYRYSATHIYILDPNDGNRRGVAIEKFIRYWDGNACVLLPR